MDIDLCHRPLLFILHIEFELRGLLAVLSKSFTYEIAAIPGHLIGPRQRKNISRQIGHERRGARPSSTPPSCSSAYGADRVCNIPKI